MNASEVRAILNSPLSSDQQKAHAQSLLGPVPVVPKTDDDFERVWAKVQAEDSAWSKEAEESVPVPTVTSSVPIVDVHVHCKAQIANLEAKIEAMTKRAAEDAESARVKLER